MFENTLPPDPARVCWAKSDFHDPSDPRWLPLWRHLTDTASIALHVWDRYAAPHVRDLIAGDVHGEATARTLLAFLAGVHDVGKCSPAFQCMVPTLADRPRMAGLPVDPTLRGDDERRLYRHELVGAMSVEDWALRRGLPAGARTAAHGLATIIAGHHGGSLTVEGVERMSRPAAIRYAGGDEWTRARDMILDRMAAETGADRILPNLAPIPRRSLILLTGLVVMADWIASNTGFVPLDRVDGDPSAATPEARAERAWARLGLPDRWTPAVDGETADGLFHDRFGMAGATTRPMQRAMTDMAAHMVEPGLMIVEAPMCDGKTEGALMATERLAARFGCDGVYYALPTMATATAMFHRVHDWAERLGGQGGLTMFLAHSTNIMDPVFTGLPDTAMVGEDSPGRTLTPALSAWMTDMRRGLLADLTVGTIDQLLAAGLKHKYAVLRHLAFAGKVIILDEVHACSAWMDTYMETTLAWLGAMHVPVIMLSATLPDMKRRAYETAYRAGAAHHDIMPKTTHARVDWRHRRRTRHAAAPAATPTPPPDDRYPLITWADGGHVETTAPAAAGRDLTVRLRMLDDSDAALARLLSNRLADGGCAVVIRDTVSRAIATARMLERDTGLPVLLVHSRFTIADRARLDGMLVDNYGKASDGAVRRGIVVATQVAEQSLDVDFDLMVSDAAPVDLLLQRAGRLHRHDRVRPARLAAPELWVSGVESWSPDRAPVFARGLERVYPRVLLMRMLAATGLDAGDGELRLPVDVPRLVRVSYGTDPVCPIEWREDETEAWRALAARVESDRTTAAANRVARPDDPVPDPYALDDWLARPSDDADRGVRGGADSVRVILLDRRDDGTLMSPGAPDMPLEPIRLDADALRAVLSRTVTLPPAAIPGYDVDRFVTVLETTAPPVWHDLMRANPRLRGMLMAGVDARGRMTGLPDGMPGATYSRKEGWTTDDRRP